MEVTNVDQPRPLNKEAITVLDIVSQPLWLYSCGSERVLWANKAALQFYNRTQEQVTAHRFRQLPPDALVHHKLVKDEVEIGRTTRVLSGFESAHLPGVIPFNGQANFDFLYKPCTLLHDDGQLLHCTMIELIRTGVVCNPGKKTFVQTIRGAGVAPDTMINGVPTVDPTITNSRLMLEILENILAGDAVDLDTVQQLHQSLIKGDFTAQPNQIAAQLVSGEELEPDVGLNLLQLLGSSKSALNSLRRAEDSLSETHRRNGSTSSLGDWSDTGSMSSPRAQFVGFVPSHLVPDLERVLATTDNWQYDAFQLNDASAGRPLSTLAFWLMKTYNITSKLKLDPTKLARFLQRIEEGYPDNPYHNRIHAADVLQGMHVLLTRGGILKRTNDELAQAASYLAAVIHDYEHKGLNNDFLVKVADELAYTYNDMSPMENHHVAGSLKLLRQQEYNFLMNVAKDKQARLRKLLIDMVLATDMKQHFAILAKFQAKLQVKLRSSSAHVSSQVELGQPSSTETEPSITLDDESDRSLVLQVALKCSDVGHLAAPWEVHHRWVSRLEEEFFRQGDREADLHMHVSPLMDRSKDGITRSQIGFFDIVALPLFHSIAAVFRDALPLVRAVEDNFNRWKAVEANRTRGV